MSAWSIRQPLNIDVLTSPISMKHGRKTQKIHNTWSFSHLSEVAIEPCTMVVIWLTVCRAEPEQWRCWVSKRSNAGPCADKMCGEKTAPPIHWIFTVLVFTLTSEHFSLDSNEQNYYFSILSHTDGQEWFFLRQGGKHTFVPFNEPPYHPSSLLNGSRAVSNFRANITNRFVALLFFLCVFCVGVFCVFCVLRVFCVPCVFCGCFVGVLLH